MPRTKFVAPGPPDADLVARYKAGDRAAADALLNRHQMLVWKQVHKLTLPDWVDRGDLFQEGQIALWRAMAAWSPGRGSKFTTYATRAVWHAVVNAARAEQKKGASLDARPFDPDGAEVLNTLPAREPAAPPAGVAEWVAALPPTHRRIVVLRFGIEGEPQNWTQIAGAVGVGQHDAKRMCGNCLDGI